MSDLWGFSVRSMEIVRPTRGMTMPNTRKAQSTDVNVLCPPDPTFENVYRVSCIDCRKQRGTFTLADGRLLNEHGIALCRPCAQRWIDAEVASPTPTPQAYCDECTAQYRSGGCPEHRHEQVAPTEADRARLNGHLYTPPVEHEHYTRSHGQMIWSTRDECVVCGTGHEYR
jgi:hypothetical protein